tara:strand:+ start:341 stop:580 length:240 start_codon:yes stop_codon:yes gene_type:complete
MCITLKKLFESTLDFWAMSLKIEGLAYYGFVLNIKTSSDKEVVYARSNVIMAFGAPFSAAILLLPIKPITIITRTKLLK